jgi:hypothetical protein
LQGAALPFGGGERRADRGGAAFAGRGAELLDIEQMFA